MPRSDSKSVVEPAARDKYLLQVTAGPSYDPLTHEEVEVNSLQAHVIENDLMKCFLNVRIRDYHGLPRGSPSTSSYFEHPSHTSDRYSIGFSFIPKKDIKGSDLISGFDFDHSIKSRLPPGFNYAMRIVTTLLDPGVYFDALSDKPYLYGPGLSSFFAFRIGEHTTDVPVEEQLSTFESDFKGVIEEGADGSGQRIRADHHIPAKTSKRRKNFLDPKKLEDFTFEAGRMYQADFFNSYLDFANFALRIPGFSISVVKYIDDKTHQLRFVMKQRSTGEVLFVVTFTLLFGEKLEETLDNRTPGGAQSESLDGQHAQSRPGTSSSNETPAPSSRSSSAPHSDVEDGERETREEKATAASTLANSIYSGFAALGFGRSSSTSSSEPVSKSTSPDRTAGKKTLDTQVDEMDEAKVADFLKDKHTST